MHELILWKSEDYIYFMNGMLKKILDKKCYQIY